MARLLRKTLVIIVLLIPLFTNTDCKKQKKCGCDGDVLDTYNNVEAVVRFSEDSESTSIYLEIAGTYYSMFTVCNPNEIRPYLEKFKSGVILNITGNTFWDCNYVWQASNSYSYTTNPYRYYNIHVTDIYMNMYGKK